MTRFEATKYAELETILAMNSRIHNKKYHDPKEKEEANKILYMTYDKFKYRENHPISYRRGIIITLEELIQKTGKLERMKYEIDKVYLICSSKYVLSNRDGKKFNNDLNYIHPENPREKFRELSYNKMKKRDTYQSLLNEYKNVLEKIIATHGWYIDDPDVTISLQKILKREIFN